MIGLPELMFLPVVVLAGGAWWLWAVSHGGRTARTAMMTGAVVALLLASAGAVFVATNWSRIAAFYHSAAAGISEMEQVQRTVQQAYGGTVSVASTYKPEAKGRMLTVTLTNPPVLNQLDPDSPAAKAKAREVALIARGVLTGQSGYRSLRIVFASVRGASFSLTRSWAFDFDASELHQ